MPHDYHLRYTRNIVQPWFLHLAVLTRTYWIPRATVPTTFQEKNDHPFQRFTIGRRITELLRELTIGSIQKEELINLCSDDFLYIKRLIINSSEKQEKYFYRDSFVEKKVLIKYYNNLVSLIPIVILFSTTFQRFERNWNLFSCFITSNCISIHRSKLLMKNMSRLIDKLME